jgi:hypothetical protein
VSQGYQYQIYRFLWTGRLTETVYSALSKVECKSLGTFCSVAPSEAPNPSRRRMLAYSAALG